MLVAQIQRKETLMKDLRAGGKGGGKIKRKGEEWGKDGGGDDSGKGSETFWNVPILSPGQPGLTSPLGTIILHYPSLSCYSLVLPHPEP